MPWPRLYASSPDASKIAVSGEQRISADSHMKEPFDVWTERLPAAFRDRDLGLPRRSREIRPNDREGGRDPDARLKDMALGGVSAEVLYPTTAIHLWRPGDVPLEEACIRAYNDWLIEFCNAAPERLWGLAMISLWDVDHAVEELERCRNAGLRGAAVWPEPPQELQFSSPHYDRFWAAAESLRMPVAMHISGGAPGLPRASQAPENDSANDVTIERVYRGLEHPARATKILADLVRADVFQRFPDLKIIIAEIGVGWMPYCAQELDYYFSSHREHTGTGASERLPSEQVYEQVYATFIVDPVGASLLPRYGRDTFMWSNDYPHAASTWPHDDTVIAHLLGHLSPEDRAAVLRHNVARLYNGGKLPPEADPPGEHQDLTAWYETHQPIQTVTAGS